MGEAYSNKKREIFESHASVNPEGNPKLDDKDQYCLMIREIERKHSQR